MKYLLMALVICCGLMSACSETDKLKENIVEMAEDYKEAQYTIEYDSVPEDLAEQIKYAQGKVIEFLTVDELERLTTNGNLLLPIQEAQKKEADLKVKEMHFEFMSLPDNSDTNTNLEYQIKVQFVQDGNVMEEYTFDGRLRIEETDDGWKIDWEKDEFLEKIL